MNSPNFASFTDMDLLYALKSSRLRPNLLVDCVDGEPEGVLLKLRALSDAPFYMCELPGRLKLPTGGRGTLLLSDVATLTIAQQVTLFDWLQHRRDAVQVISVTQQRVIDMVCDGRFREDLLYRLNTISVTARRVRRNVASCANTRPIG